MADQAGVYVLKLPLRTVLSGPDGDREQFVREVTIAPLVKAKQLRMLDAHKGDVARTIALVAQCTGLTIAQADELAMEDFVAIAERCAGFLPDGLGIGETP